MTRNRSFKVLLSGALALAVLAGAAWTASAQDKAPQDQTQERIHERIQDRIRTSQSLNDGERTQMQANLEACVRARVTGPGLETVFPGDKARQLSTQTMLQLQARVRAMAQEGLPGRAGARQGPGGPT